MNRILLIDCSPAVTSAIEELMGDGGQLENTAFDEQIVPSGYHMLILESSSDTASVISKIERLRYQCRFSIVPLVVIKQKEDNVPMEHFFTAGATEVLALDAPRIACRQIIQGYLSPSRKALDKEMDYLTPFVDNTIDVLETMASLKATFREVSFSNDFRVFGDISGIIGLSGESEGTVAITLYWDLARKIIARMVSVDEDQINAEYIYDGVGELINMISGTSKKHFTGTPYHFELSVPTVVMGSGHQLGHPEGISIAVLIFDVENTAFAVQVCLKPRPKPAPDLEMDEE